MRKLVSIVLLAGFIFYFATFTGGLMIPSADGERSSVGLDILSRTADETGSANAVTSVVVLYRGFDTLGEVTVLFLAALGISVFMKSTGGVRKKVLDQSFILKTGSRLLFPLMFLFGIYIITHGHLTPGGGFPGGVIIATGFFVVLLTSESVKFNKTVMSVLEGLAGLSFIGLGLVGLFGSGNSFLQNFLPLGSFNTVFSAGIIPIIYAVVGIKVAAELSSVVFAMKESK
ncbi:MAG: Na(+)/H(+) antiporter subunit B [Spirochaetota bacterium]|nr:Na(+)/H(+) antiporter subunit B [Spirochaetota bacterium]